MRDAVLREIDEALRPAIEADGGQIELVDVTAEGVVHIRIGKSWASSPATPLAVKYVLEMHLKRAVPGVSAVEASMDFPRPEPKR